MGTSWSQETEGSSQQQTQPPVIPSRPEPQNTTSSNTININNNNKLSNQEKRGASDISNNKNLKEEKTVVKLPHNFEAIIKDSDSPLDKSSVQKLYEQLYAGVYLNGRRKKYWVEKKGEINCFMVFARDLSITWSQDERYWHWYTVETEREGKITVAELRNVCWLEVHGRFHTTNLSPGITYEVAYLIKMKEDSSYGWGEPVNFRLTLPNGSKQEHKEKLQDKPWGEWFRVVVGEFKASQENLGVIEFSLYEIEHGHWKKGLVIKGVTIQPKTVLTSM